MKETSFRGNPAQPASDAPGHPSFQRARSLIRFIRWCWLLFSSVFAWIADRFWPANPRWAAGGCPRTLQTNARDVSNIPKACLPPCDLPRSMPVTTSYIVAKGRNTNNGRHKMTGALLIQDRHRVTTDHHRRRTEAPPHTARTASVSNDMTLSPVALPPFSRSAVCVCAHRW